MKSSICTVASAHFEPVYHDALKTTQKACRIIADAAKEGIQLLAFPEVFIPGFPHWARVMPPNSTDELFKELVQQSILIDGPEIKMLRAAAREHGVITSMGFTEGSKTSSGCIWNSNVLIGADGEILSHHRKLVPTFIEKTIYAPGDGAGLRTAETAVGKVGMLICGENTNPLARYALMAQGEQIHISSYPAVVAARDLESGGYDLTEAIKLRGAAHSFEAKAFNVIASAPFGDAAKSVLQPLGEDIWRLIDAGARAVSMIIGPTGKIISDVLREGEGFCAAEIDIADTIIPKRMHDVVAQYNRFDVFSLTVNRTRQQPISFISDKDRPS